MTYWTQLLGHPYKIEQIDVGGISTRVMTLGAGEPIIFLHGISGHLEAFVPVAPHLANDYELHLIDMLGHGWTDKPDEPITMANMASHVNRLHGLPWHRQGPYHRDLPGRLAHRLAARQSW